MTDPLAHVTSYAYDAVNRRTTTTEAVGTAVQRTSTIAYDAVGNLTALTDGLGHTTSFAYDALNRRTSTTDALGHVTTVTYDAMSNPTTVTDPLAKVTSLTYDALDRQIQTTDPLSHVTTAVLDAKGQQVGARDPLGNTNLTGFDALGRDGSALDARQGLVQKLYDSVGNLIALIDPDGNQTNFVYDGLNREILRTDPTTQSVTTTYDAAGRKTAVTDRDSRQILYSYDNANRLTGETWKDSGGTTVNTKTYTYDAKDNLLTAADGSGTYTLTYDALDRTQTQKDLFGLTLTYVYDAADRLTGRQDSLNGVLTSVYDNANRLTSRQFGGTAQTPLRIDLSWTNLLPQSSDEPDYSAALIAFQPGCNSTPASIHGFAPQQSRSIALLLRCGHCGSPMWGQLAQKDRNGKHYEWKRYVCSKYMQEGREACGYNSVREDVLLRRVAEAIRDHFSNPKIIGFVCDAVAKQEKARRMESDGRALLLRKRLAELETWIKEGNGRLAKVPEDLLPGLVDELRAWKAEQEAARLELRALNHAETQSEQAEKTIQRAIARLQALPTVIRRADQAAVRELVRSVVDSIELHFSWKQMKRRRRCVPSHGTIHTTPGAKLFGMADIELPMSEK